MVCRSILNRNCALQQCREHLLIASRSYVAHGTETKELHMAAPERDNYYTTDRTDRTVVRESNATAWFVGIIVALALLAIGYLVFSANSGPSVGTTSTDTAPITTPDTGTTPMTTVPDTSTSPMTAPAPAETAPADNGAAETPATPAPAAPAPEAPAPAAQ
jgi:hypothetical protein